MDDDVPVQRPSTANTKQDNEEDVFEAKALRFATESHQGQFRRGTDRLPYITHPVGVRDMLKKVGIKEDAVLSAALLHDTVEDCPGVSHNLIRGLFQKDIAELVMQLTDEPEVSRDERHRLQAEKMAWMDERSILIKMADRICNLNDFTAETPQIYRDGAGQRVISYVQYTKILLDAIMKRVENVPLVRVDAWNSLFQRLQEAMWQLDEAITKAKAVSIE